jgi:hypothetical protein
MRSKESLAAQQVAYLSVDPSKITVQLGPIVQVTIDLTQQSNNGTITYTISTYGYTLNGDAVGTTNNSVPTVSLGGDLSVPGNPNAGSLKFTVTSGANSSTAEVSLNIGEYSGAGYNGVIACWSAAGPGK